VRNLLATQHDQPGATLLAVLPVNGGSDRMAIVGYLLPRTPAPPGRGRRPGPARAVDAPAIGPLGPPRPGAAVRPVTAIHPDRNALVRPTSSSVPAVAEVPPADGLVLDTAGRRVLIDGRDIGLVFREFELLQFLVLHPGRALSRSEIFRSVWGEEPFESSRTVDIHVHRIRRKLGPEYGRHIVTIRRVGYRYEMADR
jgi:hypothetical protein